MPQPLTVIEKIRQLWAGSAPMPHQPPNNDTAKHQFIAKKTADNQYELSIYGIIGDWWSGDDATTIRNTIENSDADTVSIKIGTPGGDPTEAQKIGDYIGGLRKKGKKVTLDIVADTASSGTIIASIAGLKGVKVGIAFYSNYLIHEIRDINWYGMTAEQHESAAQDLRTLNASLVDMYVNLAHANGKTHVTAKHIANLMKEDKWLTAKQAYELGLVNEILTPTPNERKASAESEKNIGYRALYNIVKILPPANQPQSPQSMSLVDTLRELLAKENSADTNPPTPPPPTPERNPTDSTVPRENPVLDEEDLIEQIANRVAVIANRNNPPTPPPSKPTPAPLYAKDVGYTDSAMHQMPQRPSTGAKIFRATERRDLSGINKDYGTFLEQGFAKPKGDLSALNEVERRYMRDRLRYTNCNCSGGTNDNPMSAMNFESFQQELETCVPVYVETMLKTCRLAYPGCVKVVDNIEPNRIYKTFELSFTNHLKKWACTCCPSGTLKTKSTEFRAYPAMMDACFCPGEIYLMYYNFLQDGNFLPWQMPFAEYVVTSMGNEAVNSFVRDAFWFGVRNEEVAACDSITKDILDGLHIQLDRAIIDGKFIDNTNPENPLTSHYEGLVPFTPENTYDQIMAYVLWLKTRWVKSIDCQGVGRVCIKVPAEVYLFFVRHQNILTLNKCCGEVIDLGTDSMHLDNIGFSGMYLVADKTMFKEEYPNSFNRIYATTDNNTLILTNSATAASNFHATWNCRNVTLSGDFVFGVGINWFDPNIVSIATLPGENALVFPNN